MSGALPIAPADAAAVMDMHGVIDPDERREWMEVIFSLDQEYLANKRSKEKVRDPRGDAPHRD